MLLLFAVGVPKLLPNVSPQRVIRLGFISLFVGLVLLVALLDYGAGADIVTWPLLLAGAGIGAIASQLGSVTVSAVPDEQSGEVGGLQNTGTQLGASIGTALAGAVLISALTASFLTGIANNPAVPDRVVNEAQTSLAAGAPFMSDADLEQALSDAHVPPRASSAIVDENEKSRIDALRVAVAVLALLTLLALPFSRAFRRCSPAPNPSPAHRRHSPPSGHPASVDRDPVRWTRRCRVASTARRGRARRRRSRSRDSRTQPPVGQRSRARSPRRRSRGSASRRPGSR